MNLKEKLRKLIEANGLQLVVSQLAQVCWDLADENASNMSGSRWNQKAGMIERLADELEY